MEHLSQDLALFSHPPLSLAVRASSLMCKPPPSTALHTKMPQDRQRESLPERPFISYLFIYFGEDFISSVRVETLVGVARIPAHSA